MPHARWAWLVGTGLLFGLLHVVTGPDHLSALATLSAGESPCAAFALGIRWGLGHSSGLVVVTICFLVLGSTVINLDDIGRIGDLIVACVLMLLGAYGVYYAVSTYKNAKARQDEELLNNHNLTDDAEVETGTTLQSCDLSDETIAADDLQQVKTSQLADLAYSKQVATVAPSWKTPAAATVSDVSFDADKHDSNSKQPAEIGNVELGTSTSPIADSTVIEPEILSKRDSSRLSSSASELLSSRGKQLKEPVQQKICGMYVGGSTMQKILSFLVGVIHGVAGPGGVLAVLPAIQLHDWHQGMFYLLFFSIASTLTMGVAAGTYGTVTRWFSPTIRSRMLCQATSATMCMAVGVMWLALGITGKLDEVFP